MKKLKNIGSLLKRIWGHKQGKVGLVMVSFLILVAVFAPIIAPYDPYDVTAAGAAPSSKHHWARQLTLTGHFQYAGLRYQVSLLVGVTLAFASPS